MSSILLIGFLPSADSFPHSPHTRICPYDTHIRLWGRYGKVNSLRKTLSVQIIFFNDDEDDQSVEKTGSKMEKMIWHKVAIVAVAHHDDDLAIR